MKTAEKMIVSNHNSDQNDHIPYISTQIGNTLFQIGLHYSEKGSATLDDIMRHLIKEEVQKSGTESQNGKNDW